VNRRTLIYVAVVVLAYLTALALTAWAYPSPMESLRWLPLLGLAVASESLVIGSGEDTDPLLSFSAAAHVAAAVLFGPATAGLLAAVGVIIVDGPRLSGLRWLLPNASMFGLAAIAGGVAYQAAGGVFGSVTAASGVGLVAVVVVRYVANIAILSGGTALASGSRFPGLFADQLRSSMETGIGEGCLGVLVAACYGPGHWIMLPFLIPLLGGLYMSKVNLGRLQRETAAALNTFAQVIDERHQSTASHTKRVAAYVDRFAAAIDLPERERTRLRTAAEYHDLGKVAVDEATLSKAGRLEEAEVRAIRRHPRLSARLLAPFHFAREIALYTELHHERYDGKGYYGVDPRRIPVEAHVLIVADSFDAMTSARSYRPALTTEEAVAELRDKAGTQFHPQVAAAFAAVIEGGSPVQALGADDLARLRSSFARVPMFSSHPRRYVTDPHILFTALLAVTIAVFGVPLPWVVKAVLAVGTLAAGMLAVVRSVRDRRRVGRVTVAVREGRPAETALRLAGVDCWACWLEWDGDQERYLPAERTPAAPSGDVEVACAKAMRVQPPADAVLPSGRPLVISGHQIGEPRLAVGCSRAPSRAVRILVDHVAKISAPSDPGDAPRTRRLDVADHSLIVELGLFEPVRVAAGQLVAEDIVARTLVAVRDVLRNVDTVTQIGDDALGITLAGLSDAALGDVRDRVAAAIATVPLPRRVTANAPRFAPADSAGRDAA
jgi:hypothetical protein